MEDVKFAESKIYSYASFELQWIKKSNLHISLFPPPFVLDSKHLKILNQ